MAGKQNELLESLLAYHQQNSSEKNNVDEQELQHVFTYGTWSNGKVSDCFRWRFESIRSNSARILIQFSAGTTCAYFLIFACLLGSS